MYYLLNKIFFSNLLFHICTQGLYQKKNFLLMILTAKFRQKYLLNDFTN